jgi:hypothetical protein
MPTRAIDYRDLSNNEKKLIELDSNQRIFAPGIGCKNLVEPQPEFILADCETIYSGKNNSYIILGRDRPASRLSGYGGKGDTGAGSIDLVVGLGAPRPRTVDKPGNKLYADPNFILDSARIHISQRTDIDDNFRLAAGSVGISKGKSGIGIKADAVRVIGREGVKIVTGGDKINSQGSQLLTIPGIDLIAGNDDSDMQSIPKGENVLEAITRLADHVNELTSIVFKMLDIQNQFDIQVTTHFHNSPFFGAPNTPSGPLAVQGPIKMADHLLTTMKDLMTTKMNLSNFKLNYLQPGGAKYINSRWNKTN